MTAQVEANFKASITFPQRLLAIIQLCLAFSLTLWYATQPFMGEYFQIKSRLILYEYVFGNSILKVLQPEKLDRNAKKFATLPDSSKQQLITNYQNLYDYATRPFMTKIKEGVKSFLVDVPPFEQAWIFFSIFIAICLLLKVEGAHQALWLLPVIALAYGWDNQANGLFPFKEADQALFPSESQIVQEYVKEPLSSDINQQRIQLKNGWESYLIQNWTESSLTHNREQRLEEAEFNFTLARLNSLGKHSLPKRFFLFHQKVNPLLLIAYIGWNLFFAWIFNRKSFNSY